MGKSAQGIEDDDGIDIKDRISLVHLAVESIYIILLAELGKMVSHEAVGIYQWLRLQDFCICSGHFEAPLMSIEYE